jgi:uncharacterized membrane protein
MKNSAHLVMLIIWITAGLLSLAAGIRSVIEYNGDKVLIFILMAIVSFLFAWHRYRQRKKK